MRTTLNAIRAQAPCRGGWHKLLAYLGKTGPDDEPLPILTILESNGLDDALWCLRAVTGHEREMRLFAVWCARQVQHLMRDERSIKALDVAERYANGEVSDEEMGAAADAAWAATWAASAGADAAWAAGADAAWAATAWAATWAAWAATAAWAAARASADASTQDQTPEFIRVLTCIEAGEDPYPEP